MISIKGAEIGNIFDLEIFLAQAHPFTFRLEQINFLFAIITNPFARQCSYICVYVRWWCFLSVKLKVRQILVVRAFKGNVPWQQRCKNRTCHSRYNNSVVGKGNCMKSYSHRNAWLIEKRLSTSSKRWSSHSFSLSLSFCFWTSFGSKQIRYGGNAVVICS